jgi:hypothetical protein
MASKKIIQVDDKTTSGLGSNVVKVIDAESGKHICSIGIREDEEAVWFPSITSIEQLEAVSALLKKKKFSRALARGKTKKAQAYADRKFHT